MSDSSKPVLLTKDILAAMPSGELFKLVSQIHHNCEKASQEFKEVSEEFKIHSENVKLIHQFIQSKLRIG